MARRSATKAPVLAKSGSRTRSVDAAAGEPQFFAPASMAAIRRRLIAWYRRHRRDLPWRRTRDPYCVWISEIMLQQTQVATVIPYYERFLARFPNVGCLAAADEHEVLRHWEGLGYYRRARQLHRAARQIVAEHDGNFPQTQADVERLAGIGRYTAGAILSIALDQPAPILEANTVRLHSRLLAIEDDPASRIAQKQLWQFAAAVLPRRGAGQLNQALMELGSLVCTPRAPRCGQCPLSGWCLAKARGLEEAIPRPAKKIAAEAVREGAVVVWRAGHVLLRCHPTGERWAGLWDFPRFPLDDESPIGVADELGRGIAQQTGLRIVLGDPLATIRHSVTRFRITLDVFHARRAGGRLRSAGGGELRWLRPAELADMALSTTGRKIARLISNCV
jgi:A/G-specific adenine glycosylase